jgi:hypothetical protein
MEDLASVVMDKLKLEDGPSPFSLLWRYASMGRFSRIMSIRAVRVNGVPAYEVALCNSYWRFGDRDPDATRPPKHRWQIAMFENEKVAATFAVAFLNLQPRGLNDADPEMITYASKDLEHLFEWDDKGVAWLGARLDNADLSLYCANQLGQHAISCASDLQRAMLTLMPIKARIH